ncbi:MAG: lysozyme inhibitor LprI family protein [Proteobacteria bacterium]|nr:lysozyme inhibitor LprI family protein [Pseudomonadota bacterium]
MIGSFYVGRLCRIALCAVLFVAPGLVHAQIHVPQRPRGVVLPGSPLVRMYLSNRNLVSQRTLLLESSGSHQPRDRFQVFIAPTENPSGPKPVLSLSYENAKGVVQTFTVESFESRQRFERIEEITGLREVLLVETYYQSEGATGEGDHIGYLYVYLVDREGMSALDKIVLYSESQREHFRFYLSNASGETSLHLESLTRRTTRAIDAAARTLRPAEAPVYPRTLPSFTCESPEFAERVICEDAGLSALDQIVSRLYQPLRERPQVKASQRRWLRDRNERCTRFTQEPRGVHDCLADSYRKRVLELTPLDGN